MMRLWQVIEWEHHDGPAQGLTATIQSHKGSLQVRMQELPQEKKGVTVEKGICKH